MSINNVTKTWWNQLSIDWKYIFVYNIDFSLKEFFENHKRYKHIDISIKDLYNSIYLGKYYLDDILKKLENITSLTIPPSSTIKDLTPLEPFLNLLELKYKKNSFRYDIDLSYISNFLKLEKLEIAVIGFDLNQISGLINLKELVLYGTNTNLKPLSKLSQLNKLVLANDSSYASIDYSPIKNLINLNYLRLLDSIKDFSFLSSLIKIEKLELNSKGENFDVLSDLINLKELKISGDFEELKNPNYSFLKYLNSLEKLSLYRITMTYIPYVSLLNNLKELSLNLVSSDVSSPINLKNLEKLTLSSNGKNLDMIKLLPKLEELSLFFNQDEDRLYSEVEETDLNHLSHLSHLKKLRLHRYYCELDFLSNLKNLETLNLRGSGSFNGHPFSLGWGNEANLTPLKHLKKLKELDLYFNYSDIEPLSKLTNLEKLTLYDGNNEDIDKIDFNPLSRYGFYKNYHISSNFDESINLSPISKLINLKYLKISQNRSDLSPLKNLTNLKSLILPENLRSIKPIGNLKNLETLETFITKYDYSYRDIIPLLTNLKSLHLSGFRIYLYPAFKSHNLSELTLLFHYIEPNDLLLIRNLNKFEFSISDMKTKLDYDFLLRIAKANRVIKNN